YEVTIGEASYILPLKEFELLFLLASYPDQVFSREQLVERIWGFDYEGDERTVDVHIKRLRKRFMDLSNDFEIKTVWGVCDAFEPKKSCSHFILNLPSRLLQSCFLVEFWPFCCLIFTINKNLKLSMMKKTQK